MEHKRSVALPVDGSHGIGQFRVSGGVGLRRGEILRLQVLKVHEIVLGDRVLVMQPHEFLLQRTVCISLLLIGGGCGLLCVGYVIGGRSELSGCDAQVGQLSPTTGRRLDEGVHCSGEGLALVDRETEGVAHQELGVLPTDAGACRRRYRILYVVLI